LATTNTRAVGIVPLTEAIGVCERFLETDGRGVGTGRRSRISLWTVDVPFIRTSDHSFE
jgi:hypothetical protein